MHPIEQNRSTRLRTPCPFIVMTALVAGCGRLSSLGHPAAEPQDADEPKMASVTLAAEKLELFMEHPYLVQGQQAKFNVHLTVLEDGQPIRSGTLTVIAEGPSGKSVRVEQPVPRSPGIFGPVVAFLEAGENEMALVLKSEQADETIRVPVIVYPDEASAKKAADEADDSEPEGAISFLKEQAWKIGLVTQPVAKRRLVERLTVPGQIVPPAGAKAVVTPTIAGRVLPPASGSFPRVGQQMNAGQIVAVIEPPLAGPQGVELLVNRAQIQAIETELAAKQLDVEIEINKAKIELDYAGVVLKRAQELSTRGTVATKQFDEAQNQVKLAEANYEGKQRLREPYEQSRRQLQSLLRASSNRETDSPDLRTKPSLPGLQFELQAPVSGTVTTAQATEGEFVDATKSLFTIINMDRVWIEAKVSEYDLERVAKAPAANFTLAAYPARTFRVEGLGSRVESQKKVEAQGSRVEGKRVAGEKLPLALDPSLSTLAGTLIDIGKVVDPISRTVQVRYEIGNPDGLFRIGMFAEVAIQTTHADEMLAIPESAIVDEDGRPTAYVELEGETFQKRDIKLGIRDSGYVQVEQGLKEGERVVVNGAYAIRLASVSSVIPAHGHTH